MSYNPIFGKHYCININKAIRNRDSSRRGKSFWKKINIMKAMIKNQLKANS